MVRRKSKTGVLLKGVTEDAWASIALSVLVFFLFGVEVDLRAFDELMASGRDER